MSGVRARWPVALALGGGVGSLRGGRDREAVTGQPDDIEHPAVASRDRFCVPSAGEAVGGALGPRSASYLAWSLFALSFLLFTAGTIFWFLSGSLPAGGARAPVALFPFLLVCLAFPAVGALVASRRRDNPIGWMFCAVGVVFGAVYATQHYAAYTVMAEPGALPGGGIALWLTHWLGVPILALATFVFLLFPERPMRSLRRRPVAWLAAVAAATDTLAVALRPGPLDVAGEEVPHFPGARNPVGIDALPRDVFDRIEYLASALAAVALVLSILSLIARLRRSVGVERQQLKWILYPAAIMVAGWGVASVAMLTTGVLADVLWTIGFAGLLGVPVVTGMAILRYRLYDIDLVIRRTLVYGALTATLSAGYLGLVLVLELAFRPVTEGSSLAVAGSTLAVAALFGPVRARVQAGVDRRFYRRRYEAGRTLEDFAGRLRAETDLHALAAELSAVVHQTLQPAHVALWLRGSQTGRADQPSPAREAAGAGRRGQAATVGGRAPVAEVER